MPVSRIVLRGGIGWSLLFVLSTGLSGLFLSALVVTSPIIRADDSFIRRGSEFQSALLRPVSAVRKQAELRSFLLRLTQVQNVACVIDRRIDPDSTITVSLSQVPLVRGLETLATQARCELGTLGSTVLIGRRDEIDRILTPAALRQQELKQVSGITSLRRVDLSRTHDVSWADLDRPTDILNRIAQQWKLEIQGIDLVPHDRWYGGSAIDVQAAEALSLVLGQFDLTFNWNDGGSGVTIIPAPNRSVIEHPHRTRAMPLEDAVVRIRERFPEATVTSTRLTLIVSATVLEHDEISYLIGEKPPVPERVAGEATPLSRRRFPVTIVRTPLSKVLAALSEQEIDIQYDADELTAAGVSLDFAVSVKFDNATAEEFFTAILTPAGIGFEIDGATIILHPLKSSDQNQ